VTRIPGSSSHYAPAQLMSVLVQAYFMPFGIFLVFLYLNNFPFVIDLAILT
jgi:hypothetical protein